MADQLISSIDAGRAARLLARQNVKSAPGGSTAGCVLGNVVIMPEIVAGEFLQFCMRNPQPCPLLAFSSPGVPRLPDLGADLDIRTDIMRYRIWRDGEVAAEVSDILDVWRDDLVTFVLGCSFSFDHLLMQEGIPVRYIEEGTAAPAYITSLPTNPAGRFRGPLVVAMRPLVAAHAIRAIQISSRYPSAHGAPIHIGSPDLIGIDDLEKPDFGASLTVKDDELPVFWACGATPQAVIAASKIPFCITHGATAMLATDLSINKMAIL